MSEANKIIQLIVNSDAPIETQINAHVDDIYLNDKQGFLTKSLDKYISRKEKQIDNICNNNYRELAHIFEQLNTIKSDVLTRFKENINIFKKDIGRYKKEYVDKMKACVDAKQSYMVVQTTIEQFEKCLKMVEKTQTLLNEAASVRNCDYHHIIKSINKLQRHHLEKNLEYNFVNNLQIIMSQVLATIDINLTVEIQNWLSHARELAPSIGHFHIDQMESHKNKRKSIYNKLSTNFFIFEDFHDKDRSEVFKENLMRIDLTSLYKVLYIYELMGKSERFKMTYFKNRKIQSTILFQPLTSKSLFSSTSKDYKLSTKFREYIVEVLGFFIIEYQVFRAPIKFYQEDCSMSLWETFMYLLEESIIDFINIDIHSRRNSDNIEKENLLGKYIGIFTCIKNELVMFIEIIEIYSFKTVSLKNVFGCLFYKFIEVSKVNTYEKMQESIKTYNQGRFFRLNSDKDYIFHNEKFPNLIYSEVKQLPLSYPKEFKFEAMVLDLLDEIMDFIDITEEFLVGLPQGKSEFLEIFNNNLNDLIRTFLQNEFLKDIERKNVKTCSIILNNLKSIYYASFDIESYIKERLNDNFVLLGHETSNLVMSFVKKVFLLLSECLNRDVVEVFEKNHHNTTDLCFKHFKVFFESLTDILCDLDEGTKKNVCTKYVEIFCRPSPIFLHVTI